MSKTPKPIIHNRDHEHGGADTVRIHYESVGTGGGSGGAPQAVYNLARTPAPSGPLRYFVWSYAAGDGPLLDLTDTLLPVTVDAGVYAYAFQLNIGATVFEINNGEYVIFVAQADGSSGYANGFTDKPVQQLHGTDSLRSYGSFTINQAAGGGVYATVTNATSADHDATGYCFVQRVA